MNTTILQTLASHPLVTLMGWTLIHFLWQAAAIGIVVALTLGMMRRNSAHLRYVVACFGLAIMSAAPTITLAYLAASSDPFDGQTKPLVVSSTVPDENRGVPAISDDRTIDSLRTAESGSPAAVNPQTGFQITWAEVNRDDVGSSAPLLSRFESFTGTMQQWLPWCVMFWIAGVVCLAVRLLIGLRRVGLWRREGTEIEQGELSDLVSRLSRRMNLRQNVRLLESVQTLVPAVIGWIRPAILVPTSMLCGLTTAELESILAHELAHVRRYDYLVNLLQTVVETILFYHPAVWLLSKRIRTERENCCDDIAVEVCGNRAVLARALARMEAFRCGEPNLSIAANGGSLLGRIRRIMGRQPDCPGPWWPAGAMVLGSVCLLLGGMWITALTAAPAGPVGNQSIVTVEAKGPESNLAVVGNTDETRISETVLTDSKTGLEQRVFPRIKLSVKRENDSRETLLSMKYTNVLMYSFIPARIARELEARELGEIDFGEQAPEQKKPFQAMLRLNDDGTVKIEQSDDLDSQTPSTSKTIHVQELSEPVESKTTIVPYPNEEVWVPGHLTFYGMNQTHQHRFKIVRIDNVALGVGPKFGPVNALVLDDQNSEFGLLGMDWIQQVRGQKGEGLWFVAAEGALYFASGSTGSDDDKANAQPAKTTRGRVTVESHGHDQGPPRIDRPGVKVLAIHTYPQDTRTSTDWIEADGVQLPVDVGVEHGGIIVYQSLMYDIVAVDTKTGKSIWKIDWNKTTPMWQTVSIVQLDRGDRNELAVELYAAVEKTGELVYQYVSLKTGEKVEPPRFAADVSANKQESDNPQQLKIKPVGRDGDRITRAEVNGFSHGRSATELIRHFAQGRPDERGFLTGSTTNMETIVSASNASHLMGDWMDAPEVLFNLPEGSGLRAEFTGTNVQISQRDDSTTVVITGGKIQLIDAGGVIRASASPDGGAEHLVVECREELGEVVMTLRTRRLKEDPDNPNPPVQVVMNTATGAPADENDPPHRGIRYEILHDEKDSNKPVRMKMKWWYDMRRLAEEAEAESGMSIDQLLHGSDDHDQANQSSPNPSADDDANGWGALAQDSGLRSRLTLMTEKPAVGQPLLFRLEVKNFGATPTGVDAQQYAPFRVLRAIRADAKPTKFIGMTPQTSGEPQQLKPGESLTLWENVDANSLYLLDEGHYKFVADGGQRATQTMWRDSNSVTVQIAPGKQTPVNRFLEKLNEGLPDKWEVANGMGNRWKAIFLTHLPTSLKRDATGIQIWFTDTELPKDFELGKGGQRQIVTQLGHCELGSMNVAAQPNTLDIWPDYLAHIRNAANASLTFGGAGGNEDQETREYNFNERISQAEIALVAARQTFGPKHPKVLSLTGQLEMWKNLRQSIRQSSIKQPWSANGKVTDGEGNPIAGATVHAHCGIGSLHETGSAVTGKDGRYRLTFGPGIWSDNDSMLQAATISVQLDGHFEKNLHRQGDLLAAMQLPEDGQIGWGDKLADDVFLPGKTKEINFVMLPAAKVCGLVVDQDGNRGEGIRVSLTGDQLPPSSSVVAQAKTNAKGEYEINGIPTGYEFRILIEPKEAKSPWLAWASPPITFVQGDSGDTYLKYSIDGKPVDFSCQQLYLLILGPGVNWKTALKESAEQPLKLTWDGLATDNMIRAGVAFLELGEKTQ